MTRRALIDEPALEALRLRCADIGIRLIVEVEITGEATLMLGPERFDEWANAVAHVDALRGAAT